ncbi:hypothetical protein B7494_g8238 [Chlorociboria aeruginascens]|nr:hypothetical protein B7494_g8238 [Chlorociboria aeruginascens]
MPRAGTKKPDEGKKNEPATLSIDVDSFVRTRDSVVTGLASLQDAIQGLSSAYIKHTNAVLGQHNGGRHDLEAALSKLGENPLLTGLGGLRDPSPAKTVAEAPEKKERKKRQHDPLAPKRPLTPFFLYMQTARPIIASDLGPDFAKGAVSEEGTRRWGVMSADDKQLWTSAYKDNLRLYNARVHSYKIGHNKNAKDMTDLDASAYAEEHGIGNDTTADAQLVGEASAGAIIPEDEDAEGEPDREPTPAPKTPKAKAARKSKASATKSSPQTSEIVPPTSSIVPPKSSPEKRKRSKKGEEEETESVAQETPKATAKPRKKKSRTEA